MKSILRKSLILSLSAVAIFALAPTSLMADKPDSPPGKPEITPPESPPGNPDVKAPGLEPSLYVIDVTQIDLDADGEIDGIYATYEYDGNGNLVRKTIDEDADGTPDKTEVSTYDEDGNRLTWSYDYGTIEGTWTNTYDENGNMLTWELVVDETSKVYDTFTYDENGNLLTQTFYGGKSNYLGNIIIAKAISDYDENGLRIATNWYDDGIIEDGIDDIVTYTYDKKENMVLWSYDSDANGDPDRLIRYTYDNKGNRLSETNYYNDIESADNIKIYTYDNKGNRLTESFDNDANGEAEYILYNTWIEFD